MTVYYTIAGQKIASHWLAIGTLTTVFGGGYFASAGGSKKDAGKNTPPINASSKDEEKFIQEFIKSAEAEGNNSKAREGGH